MKSLWLLSVGFNLMVFCYPFYYNSLELETSWQEAVLERADWLIVWYVLTNLVIVFAIVVLKEISKDTVGKNG